MRAVIVLVAAVVAAWFASGIASSGAELFQRHQASVEAGTQ
ncbi:MAG: hypothetical protein JWQ76_5388 [Ramlibacter sp.]|nr:hypothetical protein [Ramlibacter sp.]